MKRLPMLLIAALVMWHGNAQAQSYTPRQIQSLIAGGQANTALAALQTVLQSHPDSGVAWYLSAEAQDALGNEAAAGSDLANAEQDAPGLPFAKPNEVAALQAHINGQAPARHGISPAALLIGGLVVLFLLLRMFGRRSAMPVGYSTYPGQPGYGPAYGPQGGGIGGGLLSGLAAGAGFAAGERIIDDLSGNRGYDQGQGFDPSQVPDRDDGLNGSPGWDDGGGNNDPGNNW